MVNCPDNADVLKFNALKPSSDKQSPIEVKNISSKSSCKSCVVHLSHHHETVTIFWDKLFSATGDYHHYYA